MRATYFEMSRLFLKRQVGSLYLTLLPIKESPHLPPEGGGRLKIKVVLDEAFGMKENTRLAGWHAVVTYPSSGEQLPGPSES